MRYSLRSLMFFIAIIAVALVIALWIKAAFVGSSGQGVSAKYANRYIWPSLRIPESANNVTFYVDIYGCEAEFAISDSEFINWCNSKSWNWKSITSPTVYDKQIIISPKWGEVQVVGEGSYYFYPPDGRGIFSKDLQRAHFDVSSFP